MDAYGNHLMFNSLNSYACPPFVGYPNMQEQPMLAVMPILIDDPSNPCNNISNYGTPIKLQTNFFQSSFQQPYQQQFPQGYPQQPGQQVPQQYQAPQMYQQQQQQQQQQQPCPKTPQPAQSTAQNPAYMNQWTQPANNQQMPGQQHQPNCNQTTQNPNICTCNVQVNLPYCPDASVQYCPETGVYSTDASRQQYRQPYKQSCTVQNHPKPVRLPTIYKNFYEPNHSASPNTVHPVRRGDEVIAEYEEVLCPQERRQPRLYSRPRCHSTGRRGHEVLAEYTEVLDYRPRNYSRGRRSNDDWSDYEDYDSHYDQRSCDQYYDRSFDRSYDNSHSYDHSHSYDNYSDNRRNVRRNRSPGPNMQFYPRGYPNEQPSNVNIDPKSNPKISRQIYNGTPAQSKQNIENSRPDNASFNDFRNSRSTPVANQPPPRNLRTPRDPPSYRQ